MKYRNLYLLFFLLIYSSCSDNKAFEPDVNFNVILELPETGQKIELRNGNIFCSFLKDYKDSETKVVFKLDSLKFRYLVAQIPWQLLDSIPDNFNPKCEENPYESNEKMLRIVNGTQSKKIRLAPCMDNSNDAIKINKFEFCVRFLINIVYENEEVINAGLAKVTL